MKKYPSKISWGLAIPLFSILFASLLLTISVEAWVGGIVTLLTLAFVIHLYLNTYYAVDEDILIIKSGFLINIKIPIHRITKISGSKTILSSPALSFDRLEITYGKYDSVLISPKNKAEFIADLKSRNPNIKTEV